jgi:Glycosyl transferase family 2
MTTNPAITWLMPVRNGMPYIPLTLRSIAEQTYRNHKIIVWDNGSTDGTIEELRRWIPSRIPGTVVSERPMRLGPSLAALIEMADTEFCARIDADDINMPERLQLQVEFMRANPAVGVLGGQLAIIDEHGHRQGAWRFATGDAEIRWRLRWESHMAHNAVLFRKSVVLAAGNYRDCQPVEDIDLWRRVAAIAEIRSLPDMLVEYRRTDTSSTGTISDYIPTDRKAALMTAPTLFLGLSDPRRAMSLWEATHPRQLHVKSKLQHIWQLERAATLMAQAAGKPADYFTSTQMYQDQHYSLKTRAFQRMGLTPLLALKYRLAHGF